jgi:hypothetical protein
MWPESTSELHRPSGCRLSAKLVPTFADRGCLVVSATDPCDRNLGFIDRSRYFLFQVAPELYSRGCVDPVPDPLLLRISGRARNRTRDLWICSQELWPLDYVGGLNVITTPYFAHGMHLWINMITSIINYYLKRALTDFCQGDPVWRRNTAWESKLFRAEQQADKWEMYWLNFARER